MLLPGHNLMIVAHPDDETIFGHTQLANPEADWTVVCMTNADNPVRAAEFRHVVTYYGAKHEIWGYEDRWDGGFDVDSVTAALRGQTESRFDHVLTHGINGEYGHSQHIALHNIVKSLVTENLWVFCTGDYPLPFDTLQAKFEMLARYESQCHLQAWDWYDTTNPCNRLMNWIVSEHPIQFR